MNPRTMVLQWFGLIGLAGVSFYYTKKSINERRKTQGAHSISTATVDAREHAQNARRDNNASNTGSEIGSAVQSSDTDSKRSGGVGAT